MGDFGIAKACSSNDDQSWLVVPPWMQADLHQKRLGQTHAMTMARKVNVASR